MKCPVIYDGDRFLTEKSFVEAYSERLANAIHSAGDLECIKVLIETTWERLTNYGATTYDYKLNQVNCLTCKNTNDCHRLIVGKDTLKKCFKVLKRECLTQPQADMLTQQMHARKMTTLARRLISNPLGIVQPCESCDSVEVCDRDHVIPFEAIWNEFKEANDTTTYDDSWRSRWKRFHHERAVYQSLCKGCHKEKSAREAGERKRRRTEV